MKNSSNTKATDVKINLKCKIMHKMIVMPRIQKENHVDEFWLQTLPQSIHVTLLFETCLVW
jgi:hypothetical protein